MISKLYKNKVQFGQSHWLKRESPVLEIIKLIKIHFKKVEGLKLLDIGCAQGREVYKLSKYGIIAEGLDSNKGFIDEARKLYPNIKFGVGNIENLTTETKFDIVLCINTLFYTNIEKSLPRIENLLKTGGLAIITLDEKITGLDKNKEIHSLSIEKALMLLKRSKIIQKKKMQRTDLKPFKHRHTFYRIILEKF